MAPVVCSHLSTRNASITDVPELREAIGGAPQQAIMTRSRSGDFVHVCEMR